MTLLRLSLLASALAAPLLCFAQAPTTPPVAPPVKATKPVPAAHTAPDPGERAFQANCFRCHQAPESLNPRITGTVLRHMRVRANLSAKDEADILRFLNP